MAAKHKRRNLQRDVDEAVRLSDKTLGATSRPGSSLESPLPPTTSISGFKPSSYMAPGGRTTMVPGVDPSVDRVAWAPYRPTQEPPPDQYPGFDPREKRFGSGSWGASGTPITAGYLLDLGEYNPAVYGRQAVLQYEKMRRGDAQVWATLTTPKQVLLSAEWDVIPGIKPDKPGYAKAKEVAEFAKENLFGGLEFETSSGGVHSQAFFSVVRNAMLMLDFGCSAHEDVWHLDGEYIRLRALPARLPITFYRWHTEVDGETLTGLEQYGYRGWEFVNLTLPMNKACFFSYNQEGANFWGIALSRIMYPHWYIAPLALDTPVPTKDGWRTVESLEVGDEVFNELGKRCQVLGKSEVWKDRTCYRVTFSDGESVVTDQDHLWLTQTHGEINWNKPPRSRSTWEIGQTVHYKNGSTKGLRNHAIWNCEPVEYEEKDLPVHPYVLGLWLGDGAKDRHRISCNAADADELRKTLVALGEKDAYIEKSETGNLKGGRIISIPKLLPRLKQIGVCCNKHVPDIYLQGSVEQRRELLAGLLDSDGNVGQGNKKASGTPCGFSNTNKRLIDGVLELVRSLGDTATAYVSRPAKGEQKQSWKVGFVTAINPFRLSRQRARFRPRKNTSRRTVVSVERVESVPVQCVAVANDSHLFLIGKNFTPTHNSNLYRIDAISSERNGVGLPVITLNEGFSAQDKSNAFEFVTKLAAHELAGLVLPPKSEFRLVGVTGSTHDVMKGIEHHKRQMSIAALQHFLTVGTAPHGSRATAAVQHNFFMQAVEHLAEHVCATITHATLRRLCRYNFGEDAVVPKLLAKNLKSSDITDILAQLVQMAGSGLIVSEKNIRDYLRQELELPVESTEGIIAPKGETIEPITEEATSPITGQKGGTIGGVSKPKTNGQGGPNLAGKGVAASEIRRHLWLEEQKDVKLIVARHGETDDDAVEDDEVMSGWSDIALNERGREQAAELAEKLKDKGIVAIRSSPLQRTMETARAVSDALGIPVTQDAGLRSMNFGRHLDGASVNGNKHELQECLENKDHRLAPDSETRGEFMENFRGAVERASEQSIKMRGPVLIVTHSWNTRAVPLVLAGKLETDHKKPMKPGEVESIEHEAGGWKAVQLSARRMRSKDVIHLDLDEARRSVDHGRDKLAALLTGSDKARLIHSIARQTVLQMRRGVPVAELRYASPPDLAHKILPHVRQLFAQAKEQAKKETEKLIGRKRR